MSSWEGISEFLMVVETGGFTAAGRRLDVSTSHVSRQVARLEDRLGVKLLARSTRTVRLTDAGVAYHSKISDLAAGIEEVNQAAAGADAELAGRIRVSAAGVYAEQFVAPALARFARENPRVSIELDFNTRNVDLIDQGFDFAIRYGVLADSGLIARKISGRTMVCAASPVYLDRYGEPEHPNDLRHHACLKTNQDRWSFTDPRSGEIIDVRISGSWSANNGHALRHAAVEGLGIAYSPRVNLASALEAGDLVPILNGYEDRTRSSWIVYPERRHMPLRVRRAIDYLVTACGP
ncbi:MAG: LysR family transcriptional regulator [Pseudomonadota bacterium]